MPKLMFRAKRTGVLLSAWDKLNNDKRYELVEVDDKGGVTLSRYTKVDGGGNPVGGMQPVKGAPPKPALLDTDIDDLIGGV